MNVWGGFLSEFRNPPVYLTAFLSIYLTAFYLSALSRARPDVKVFFLIDSLLLKNLPLTGPGFKIKDLYWTSQTAAKCYLNTPEH